MVIVLLFQVAFTPVGNPVIVPIPVAPVVAMVMDGDNASLIQMDRVDGAVTVLINTVIVPAALTVPHPPVNEMV